MHTHSYWSMATFMTSHWVVAQISHSRPAIATNAHACMVLLLNGVASHDLSPPWAGFLPGDHLWQSGPLATKRTNHGSHIVGSGGPSTATQFGVDGPGDQLWRGTTCGVTSVLYTQISALIINAAFSHSCAQQYCLLYNWLHSSVSHTVIQVVYTH